MSSLAEGSQRRPRMRWYHTRWQRWMTRRLPPQPSIELTQRRLFIFPSRPGLAFLGVLAAILVAAINYENNMAYALTFWLGSVFVVAVHMTFANLHRLQVQAAGAAPVFAGQQARLVVRFSARGRRSYHGLTVGWGRVGDPFSVPGRGSFDVSLFCRAPMRGWFDPGRFLLETRYPLGLLRCWTWLDLGQRVLVYPTPLAPTQLWESTSSGGHDGPPRGPSGEELADFKAYQPGDSLKSIAWAAYARNDTLVSKVMGDTQAQDLWLDFSKLPAAALETRLSWLCWLVLDAHSAQLRFGLRLPGVEVAPALGEPHRDAALRALALYTPGAAA
jgi:uncharacterized protein (DUF58 family)